LNKRNFECVDGNESTGSHWTQFGGEPTILIDFHHTISTRCGACEGEDIMDLSAGVPQVGVEDALRELRKNGFRIVIYTGFPDLLKVSSWLSRWDIPFDDVMPKPNQAAFIIDDRAIHHTGWKETLREIQRRASLKPLRKDDGGEEMRKKLDLLDPYHGAKERCHSGACRSPDTLFLKRDLRQVTDPRGRVILVCEDCRKMYPYYRG